MYHDPGLNLTTTGYCYYSCYELDGTVATITTSAAFNARMCAKYGVNADEKLHRTGRFCGQCSDSYGLAAYSYQLFNAKTTATRTG